MSAACVDSAIVSPIFSSCDLYSFMAVIYDMTDNPSSMWWFLYFVLTMLILLRSFDLNFLSKIAQAVCVLCRFCRWRSEVLVRYTGEFGCRTCCSCCSIRQ